MANLSVSSSDEESTRSSFGDNETSVEELLSDTEDSPKVEVAPSKRSRKVPARFKDSACSPSTTKVVEEFDAAMKDKKVSVKCNQTGKAFKVKVASLSRVDDGNMSAVDLAEGSQLLMKMNRKEYPVTVMKGRPTLKEALKEVQDKKQPEQSGGKKRPATDGLSRISRCKKSKTNSDKENDLLLAKAQLNNPTQTSNSGGGMPSTSTADKSTASGGTSNLDRELLLQIGTKLDTLISLFKASAGASGQRLAAVKEEEDNSAFIVDGVNLLRIPSKDAGAYGRALVDTLFTKAEQKSHVLFKTSKSSKPPLDRVKVGLMFDCIERRYGGKFDYRALVTSLKQKCRDAKPDQ